MKKVKVEFQFEGVIRESEIETGILFANGLVFVAQTHLGLYVARPTLEDGVVLVDLDTNSTDYLQEEDPSIIIDLITVSI